MVTINLDAAFGLAADFHGSSPQGSVWPAARCAHMAAELQLSEQTIISAGSDKCPTNDKQLFSEVDDSIHY